MPVALLTLGTLFWAAMLLYCIVRDPEERHIWIFVILFLNVVGAALYFVVRVLPRLGLHERLVLSGRRRREIARVEADLVHFDRPHLWQRLGELRLESGDLAGAEEALGNALAKEDDLDSHWLLARVARAKGDLAGAAARLERVVARSPDHAYGEARRLLARTWLESGRAADARKLYEDLVRTHPSAEVRYHYALILVQDGETDRARAELDRVAVESKALPEFGKRAQREWIGKAKAARRRL